MNAASLAAHAVVALENARLHGMVERQALVDGLTGLANRRAASDALHAEAARAERLETPLSVVLADLDEFKEVNDEHGHAVGDEVLRAFAEVLRETLRESDLAGRWGGEEFLLLLPGADEEGAAQLAERVRVALAARRIPSVPGLRVTASFGVAEYAGETNTEQLVAAADGALYRAKRGGKGSGRAGGAGRPFDTLRTGSTAAMPRYHARRRRARPHGRTLYAGRDTVYFRAGHQGAPRSEGAELEARRRDADRALQGDGDPFENHPLFKSEEQARIEETMDGVEPDFSDDEPRGRRRLARRGAARRGNGRDARGRPCPPIEESAFWGNGGARDFDWGD